MPALHPRLGHLGWGCLCCGPRSYVNTSILGLVFPREGKHLERERGGGQIRAGDTNLDHVSLRDLIIIKLILSSLNLLAEKRFLFKLASVLITARLGAFEGHCSD